MRDVPLKCTDHVACPGPPQVGRVAIVALEDQTFAGVSADDPVDDQHASPDVAVRDAVRHDVVDAVIVMKEA